MLTALNNGSIIPTHLLKSCSAVMDILALFDCRRLGIAGMAVLMAVPIACL
jgi:hypothetical protein